MTLFETDFLQKLGTLLKEAFKFKKYKAMNPVLAVFTGLLMLPFVLISFAITAVLALLGFVFAVFTSPVKYLHALVSDEGKNVKHATQFIVYFISWPFVFMSYVVMSFLLLLIIPTYALLSIVTYIWTLGGFKFHLFMNKFDCISIEVNGRYCPLAIVFVCIGWVAVLFAPAIHAIIHYIDLYNQFRESEFVSSFIGIYAIYLGVYMVFATIYSLVGFARRPKAKKAVEAVETAEVEAVDTVEAVEEPAEATEEAVDYANPEEQAK